MDYEQRAKEMRFYESLYEQKIPVDHWFVVRLDGRSFTKLTEKHFKKPFDSRFQVLMVSVTKQLLMEFSAPYAYIISDEISLLFPPQWSLFDQRVEKITTLLAACASGLFCILSDIFGSFDARMLSFETFEQVVEYFDWRIADGERNALQTTIYWTLREKMSAGKATTILTGASVAQKLKLLTDHTITYNELPVWQRYGLHLYWNVYKKDGFNPQTQETTQTTRKVVVPHDDFSSLEEYHVWFKEYCKEL